MYDSIETPLKLHRSIQVDMSSEAIAQRLREAGELNRLGESLARAKPIKAPEWAKSVPMSDSLESDTRCIKDGSQAQ
jgi:hypothetical protein